MQQALKLMVNLKHLVHEESIGRDVRADDTASFLTEECTFQLISLAWASIVVDYPQTELEMFEHFLFRQRELKSLSVKRYYSQSPTTLPLLSEKFHAAARIACPQLEDLYAPLDIVLAMLPTKSQVKSISWPTLDSDEYRKEHLSGITTMDLVSCSSALETLETLDYQYGIWDANRGMSELRLICPHLKNLVHLVVDDFDVLKVGLNTYLLARDPALTLHLWAYS